MDSKLNKLTSYENVLRLFHFLENDIKHNFPEIYNRKATKPEHVHRIYESILYYKSVNEVVKRRGIDSLESDESLKRKSDALNSTSLGVLFNVFANILDTKTPVKTRSEKTQAVYDTWNSNIDKLGYMTDLTDNLLMALRKLKDTHQNPNVRQNAKIILKQIDLQRTKCTSTAIFMIVKSNLEKLGESSKNEFTRALFGVDAIKPTIVDESHLIQGPRQKNPATKDIEQVLRIYLLNDQDCNFYRVPPPTSIKDIKENYCKESHFKESYILVEDKVFYINGDGEFKPVPITNPDTFHDALNNYLPTKTEETTSYVPTETTNRQERPPPPLKIDKIQLNNNELNTLITANGGHTRDKLLINTNKRGELMINIVNAEGKTYKPINFEMIANYLSYPHLEIDTAMLDQYYRKVDSFKFLNPIQLLQLPQFKYLERPDFDKVSKVIEGRKEVDPIGNLDDFSDAEKASIYLYTSELYRVINPFLREKKLISNQKFSETFPTITSPASEADRATLFLETLSTIAIGAHALAKPQPPGLYVVDNKSKMDNELEDEELLAGLQTRTKLERARISQRLGVVLTGSGPERVAYFINNKQYVQNGNKPLSVKISLSDDEIEALDKAVHYDNNGQTYKLKTLNNTILEQITQRALNALSDGCDACILLSLEDKPPVKTDQYRNYIDNAILEDAKKNNTPIILKIPGNKYLFYGDPNGDGNWKFTYSNDEYNINYLNKNKNIFISGNNGTIIKRGDEKFYGLIGVLKEGHAPYDTKLLDTDVYRGEKGSTFMHEKVTPERIQSTKSRKPIKEHAFTSTSTDKDIANEFIDPKKAPAVGTLIQLSETRNLRDVSSASFFVNENEILLAAGTDTLITKYEEQKDKINYNIKVTESLDTETRQHYFIKELMQLREQLITLNDIIVDKLEIKDPLLKQNILEHLNKLTLLLHPDHINAAADSGLLLREVKAVQQAFAELYKFAETLIYQDVDKTQGNYYDNLKQFKHDAAPIINQLEENLEKIVGSKLSPPIPNVDEKPKQSLLVSKSIFNTGSNKKSDQQTTTLTNDPNDPKTPKTPFS